MPEQKSQQFESEDLKLLDYDLKNNKHFSMEEIISSSDDGVLKKMGVADFEIFNPEFGTYIENTRKMINTALKDEEILSMFVKIDNHRKFRDNAILLVEKFMSQAKIECDDIDQQKNFTTTLFINEHRATYMPSINITKVYLKNAPRPNLYDSFCEYADRYFQAKYILEKIIKAKTLIKQYFPDLYKDFPPDLSKLV